MSWISIVLNNIALLSTLAPLAADYAPSKQSGVGLAQYRLAKAIEF